MVNTFILVKGFTHRSKLFAQLSEFFEMGVLVSALFTSIISLHLNICFSHKIFAHVPPLVLAVYHFQDGGNDELHCSALAFFLLGDGIQAVHFASSLHISSAPHCGTGRYRGPRSPGPQPSSK